MFKKFITPDNASLLFVSIDNIDFFDNKLKYRIEKGYFSEDCLEKSIGIFYVDTVRRKVAGMAFVYIDKEVLADVEVMKEYQRKGIGTKIVKDAISLGAKYLSVKDDNVIAINIYKKCGFKDYYYDVEKNLYYMSLTGKPNDEDIAFIKNKIN